MELNNTEMKMQYILDENKNLAEIPLTDMLPVEHKEQKDISGKLSFVNIVREYTLKTIIADAIRAKLFQ